MHNNKDYSTTKAISNSSLGMMKISPKQFIKFYNQQLEEKDEIYFKEGSAIHSYVLEPLEFASQYVFIDYEMPNSPNKKKFIESYLNSKGKEETKLKKAYKDNYSTVLNDDIVLKKARSLKKELSSYVKYLKEEKEGKIVLNSSYEKKLKKIKKELTDHEFAKELLFKEPYDFDQFETFNEYPIYWTYQIEDRSYDFKALIDRFIIDFESKKIRLVDLKTTRKIHDFETSFDQFGYDRQLAFYSIAIMKLFEQKYPNENIEDYDVEHFIVAINKEEEPESRVFKVSKDKVLEATKEIHELVNRVHWHFKHNKWDRPKEQYLDGYETL